MVWSITQFYVTASKTCCEQVGEKKERKQFQDLMYAEFYKHTTYYTNTLQRGVTQCHLCKTESSARIQWLPQRLTIRQGTTKLETRVIYFSALYTVLEITASLHRIFPSVPLEILDIIFPIRSAYNIWRLYYNNWNQLMSFKITEPHWFQ